MARINSSHLRASILHQIVAAAAVAVVTVAVAAAAVGVDVVVAVAAAAAADVGIAFAATSHWRLQLVEAEDQLDVVVAGDGVEPVVREGLGGNCWGRQSMY